MADGEMETGTASGEVTVSIAVHFISTIFRVVERAPEARRQK